MCSWDIIGELSDYGYTIYPEIDIITAPKKFKQRTYEIMILDDIMEKLYNRPYDDPIDILELYEITYYYYIKTSKSKIFKYQLNVIRKLLIFLRRREKRYG